VRQADLLFNLLVAYLSNFQHDHTPFDVEFAQFITAGVGSQTGHTTTWH